MDATKLFEAIANVREARTVVQKLGANRVSKTDERQRARSTLALAESKLREEGLRLDIRVTVLDPEPERRAEQVCARQLKGYRDTED